MKSEYITLKKPEPFFCNAILGLVQGSSRGCYKNELEEYLFKNLKKNASFKTDDRTEFKTAQPVVKYNRNREILGTYNSMAECLRSDGLKYGVDPIAKEIYQCFYTGRLCSNGCYYEPYSNEGVSYTRPLDNIDRDLRK